MRVVLTRQDGVAMPEEVGTIMFRGIAVHELNGGLKVPVNAAGERNSFSYECRPRGLVSQRDAQYIADRLSSRIVKGEVAELEWQVAD